MILIIRERVTPEQMAQMSEAFGETLIKLAVDVERGIWPEAESSMPIANRHCWRTAADNLTFGAPIGIRWNAKLALNH